MNAKMLTVVALSGLLALGVLSANAADGRDPSLYGRPMHRSAILEGRNAAAVVDTSTINNEDAAIRLQIEANSRSTR